MSPSEPPSTALASLNGQHVIMTRPRQENAPDPSGQRFRQQLEAWGIRYSHIPLIQIESCAPRTLTLPEANSRIPWLFFTSPNAVRCFFESPASQDSRIQDAAIAVVGPSTAESLQRFQRTAQFIAPEYNAQSAAQAFLQTISPKPTAVLWPCGNLASPKLQQTLSRQGVQVFPWMVYRTSPRSELSPQEQAQLQQGADLLILTSPSGIIALQHLLQRYALHLDALPLACLGPQTTQACLQQLGPVAVSSSLATLDTLALAIQQYFLQWEPTS